VTRAAAAACVGSLLTLFASGCGDDGPQKVMGCRLADFAPAGSPLYAEFPGKLSGSDRENADTIFKKVTNDDHGADDFIEGWTTGLIRDIPGWDSLDYKEDIEPWLGNRGAIYSIDDDDLDTAMVVVTTDASAADAAADKAESTGGDTTHTMIGNELVVGEEKAVDAVVPPDSTRPSLADDADVKKALDTSSVRDSVALFLGDTAKLIQGNFDFPSDPSSLIEAPPGQAPLHTLAEAPLPAAAGGSGLGGTGLLGKFPYDSSRPILATVGLGDERIDVEGVTPIREGADLPDPQIDADRLAKIPASAFAGFSNTGQTRVLIGVLRKAFKAGFNKQLHSSKLPVGRGRFLRFLRKAIGADIFKVTNSFTGPGDFYGTGDGQHLVGVATLATKAKPADILNVTRFAATPPTTPGGRVTVLPAPGAGMRALQLSNIGPPGIQVAVVAAPGTASILIAKTGTDLGPALRELGTSGGAAPADRGHYSALLPSGFPLVGFGTAEPFAPLIPRDIPPDAREGVTWAVKHLNIAIGDRLTGDSETLHYTFSTKFFSGD
jgi:hypothetical protein